MDIFDCIYKRRDSRHFLDEDIPKDVLHEALLAAHHAPSVGLSTPWRFVVTKNPRIKGEIHRLYQESRNIASQSLTQDETKVKIHSSLKLAAILDAPLGVAVFCEEPPSDKYTIGVIGSRDTLQWSCACAVQNFWLALTARGYGAGWVSILDFNKASAIFSVPKHWKFMGYLCVGKPATDYGGQPMLAKEGWRRPPETVPILYR